MKRPILLLLLHLSISTTGSTVKSDKENLTDESVDKTADSKSKTTEDTVPPVPAPPTVQLTVAPQSPQRGSSKGTHPDTDLTQPADKLDATGRLDARLRKDTPITTGKVESHSNESKTKTAAVKPKTTLKTSSEVAHKPGSKTTNQSGKKKIKTSMKPKKAVVKHGPNPLHYQVAAPPSSKVTHSPVDRSKHVLTNIHRPTVIKLGHNISKKQRNKQLYIKHVGKTARGPRRRGHLLPKEEYLRVLTKHRQRYLRRLRQLRQQRRQRYLKYLRQRKAYLERLRRKQARVNNRTGRVRVMIIHAHPTNVAHTKTKTVKHHQKRVAKAQQLQTYLTKKTDAEKQKHDAERKIVQAYLLFRLYEMVRSYLKKANSCKKHFIEIKVGADSPAFGGALIDSPSVFLSDFSITGFDDTMSRLELYGCRHLPNRGKLTNEHDPTAPCGNYTLLWVWYNGQSPVKLPEDIAVLAGYKTDIHFLVARLTKFSSKPHLKPPTTNLKTVQIHFADCMKPKKYRHSNYRFVRDIALSDHRNPHTDISCENKAGFLVYGLVGEMGPFGKGISVWSDKHPVTNKPGGAVNNASQTTPTTQILIGSVPVSHKVHLLPKPIYIGPGEVLKTRCEYYSTISSAGPGDEICKMTLMTMVPQDSSDPAPICNSPAEFGSNEASLEVVEVGLVHFLQGHPYGTMVVVGVVLVLGLLVWRWRQRRMEDGGVARRGGATAELEFQGLLTDYDGFDYDRNLKKK